MTWRRNNSACGQRGGFTLLEVTLALSIITVLSGIMYWFFWNITVATEQQTSRSRDVQLVRVILDHMACEIRQASGFVPGYGPGVIGTKHMISINTAVLPDKKLLYPRSITDVEEARQFDLREVRYYIGWDEENLDEEGDPRALGLVRRVSKTYLREMIIEGEDETDSGDEEQIVAVKEELYAPELKYIEFKYFDGATWWDDWEIAQGNTLPQIVRVTIGFEPVPPREEEMELVEDDFLCDEEDQEPLAADRFAMFIRLVQADTFFGSRLTREASAFSSSESSKP
ncbi:MAG: prepilin-type N-terminal cleavage/methylation domain-containing protein [Phycisphaerae bacterium]|nr:prepilin-type N-terminal cleavage/methylation domain-containing protein [Phycisphaerae bacterium]